MSMFTEFSCASVILTLLPDNGRRLCLTTCPDIGQYSHFPVVYTCCLTQETWTYSRWNFVAIMYTSWDIRNIISTSGYWPPSLIYDIPRHQTASLFFNVCFMALTTCNCHCNCFAIMHISWDTCYYIISAVILDFWLPVSSGSVTDSTIEKYDSENMGIDTRIMF